MKKIILIAIVLMLNACVKDVNFDQKDEVTFTRPVNITLVHFKLSNDEFYKLQSTVSTSVSFQDEVKMSFDKDLINNITSDINLKYIIENQLNINATIVVNFKDSADNIVFTKTLNVVKAISGNPSVINDKMTLTANILKLTTHIAYSVTSSGSVSQGTQADLIFKSALSFDLKN